MKATLKELRQIVRLELFEEALDVGSAANKGLGSRGIVVQNVHAGEYIIAVSMKELATYEIAYNGEFPKVLGSASGQRAGDVWMLRTLYADDPVTAVMLLAAALERWGHVIPDDITTPASQAVIKRYFQTYKNDPQKIENADKGFLGATYLGPVGFNMSSAEANGDKAVKDAIDPDHIGKSEEGRVKTWLQIISKKGFEAAYTNMKRTKEF